MLRHFRPRSHSLDFPLARGRGPRDFRTRRSPARAPRPGPLIPAPSRAIGFFMRRFRTLAPLLVTPLLAHCSMPAHPAPSSAATPMMDSVARPIARKTAGWEKHAGFLSIYFDAASGKLMLEIPRDSLRALLFVELATGLARIPSDWIEAPTVRRTWPASRAAGRRCCWCSRTGTIAARLRPVRRMGARWPNRFHRARSRRCRWWPKKADVCWWTRPNC